MCSLDRAARCEGAQAVVAGAVGDRRNASSVSRSGVRIGADGLGLMAAGERIQDDVSAGDPGFERFRTGRLDSSQAVGENGGEDLDHLPVAVVAAFQLAPDAIDVTPGSTQSLNGAPFRSAPGFARQNRHVMPGIVDNCSLARSGADARRRRSRPA